MRKISNELLKKGFTTGTAAAAATKAAAFFITQGVCPEQVDVDLPCGGVLKVAVKAGQLLYNGAVAGVIKDAGDDPDVTGGLEIVSTVKKCETSNGEIVIKGGLGVGVVTKPGLQVPPGEAAINPVPKDMVLKSLRAVIPQGGYEVVISVPHGEDAAKNTFNSRLGILGGISIIGTTGLVEPMSLKALKETIKCEIDVSLAQQAGGNKTLNLAPGKIGERALKENVLGDRAAVVQMSNFIGFALEYAVLKGVQGVIVGGHPGKLAKILMGYLDTHSKNSPQATDFVRDFLGLSGSFNTVEEIIGLGNMEGLSRLACAIAEDIKKRFKFIKVRVCLFDMKKTLVGDGFV